MDHLFSGADEDGNEQLTFEEVPLLFAHYCTLKPHHSYFTASIQLCVCICTCVCSCIWIFIFFKFHTCISRFSTTTTCLWDPRQPIMGITCITFTSSFVLISIININLVPNSHLLETYRNCAPDWHHLLSQVWGRALIIKSPAWQTMHRRPNQNVFFQSYGCYDHLHPKFCSWLIPCLVSLFVKPYMKPWVSNHSEYFTDCLCSGHDWIVHRTIFAAWHIHVLCWL